MTARQNRIVDILACIVAGLIIHWIGGPWWAAAMTYVLLINIEKAKR